MAATPKVNITAISGYVGLHLAAVIRAIVESMTVQNDMNVIYNLTAPRILWQFVAGKGLRPVDTSVNGTTKNQGAFSARTITPKVGMKILEIVPEDLRDTFFSEQLKPNAKEYPEGFAEYFWEEQAKALGEEIELNIFDSVDPDTVPAFNPASTYAVGARVQFQLNVNDGVEFFRAIAAIGAGESPATNPAKWTDANAECVVKGIGTIIKAERTAGNLAGNVITTGALTNSNALDKIDTVMWGAIPEKVKRVTGGVTFYMSYNVYNKRKAALRALKGGGNFYSEADLQELMKTIQDSDGRGKVKPCSWMGESQMVIATIDNNLTMGTNVLADITSIGKMIETLHGYKAIMKMILAFQVADLKPLYVNDLN